ncbi:MAG: hypothetical protein KDB03_15080 [Planctomycetales bacterium]|nr:hypothetical protein [Planctomycetales bacterium]
MQSISTLRQFATFMRLHVWVVLCATSLFNSNTCEAGCHIFDSSRTSGGPEWVLERVPSHLWDWGAQIVVYENGEFLFFHTSRQLGPCHGPGCRKMPVENQASTTAVILVPRMPTLACSEAIAEFRTPSARRSSPLDTLLPKSFFSDDILRPPRTR